MEGIIRWPAGVAMPVSGIATTIKYALGHNLGLAKKLSLLQSGDVLVVDAQGFSQCYVDDSLQDVADALRDLFDLADEIDFDCSRIEPP